MQSIIEWLYSWSFKLFGIKFNTEDLTTTITNMCDFAKVKTKVNTGGMSLYALGNILNGVIIPVGTSLLTLFFIISLVNMVQEGVERITWERITFKGIIFFVFNFLIIHSYELLTAILNTANVMFTNVQERLTVYMSEDNASSIAGMLNKIIDEADFIDSIMYFAVFLILAIPFNATIIMIITQVFTRIVKLMCCIAFAPIPIAMAAEGNTFRGKAISYFTYTAAIGCEAILIYIGLFLYNIGFNQIGKIDGPITTIIAILFLNGIFSAVISFGSQFCEKIFGRW